MDAGKVLHYLKKIKPYNIQKGFRYLKHYGLKEFWIRLCERMEFLMVPGLKSTDRRRVNWKSSVKKNGKKHRFSVLSYRLIGPRYFFWSR